MPSNALLLLLLACGSCEKGTMATAPPSPGGVDRSYCHSLRVRDWGCLQRERLAQRQLWLHTTVALHTPHRTSHPLSSIHQFPSRICGLFTGFDL